jgi:hypothetical protein
MNYARLINFSFMINPLNYLNLDLGGFKTSNGIVFRLFVGESGPLPSSNNWGCLLIVMMWHPRCSGFLISSSYMCNHNKIQDLLTKPYDVEACYRQEVKMDITHS